MKLGIVVVTHGQLATELVNSAEMIVGDLPHFAAVSIGWHEDVDHAREGIGAAIARVSASAGGSDEELMTVDSIVNSLARNVPQVQAVQFLIEGHPVSTLAGHVDLTAPLRAAGDRLAQSH